ncbi:hypothetical protein ACHAXT_008905 [Thalassiosira profunda]
MAKEQLQAQLHPAVDVLRDQLLRGVAEENEKLRGDINSLLPARDYLGSIELQLRSGHVTSTSIAQSVIVKKPDGSPYLVSFLEGNPLPLADFGGGEIRLSGQLVGVFPENGARFFELDEEIGSICMRIPVSRHVLVTGNAHGLSDDEMNHLKSFSIYEEHGLRAFVSSSVIFTPMFVQMRITDQLRKTIRLFGELPAFESIDDIGVNEIALDAIERPLLSEHDEARHAIIEALGCTSAQMNLLRAKNDLKEEHSLLEKAKEMLGAVVARHKTGTIRFSLEEGVFVEGQSAYWIIAGDDDHDHSLVAMNDLGSLELSVSGATLQKETIGFNGSRTFVNTYRNGAHMFGLFDEEAMQGMGADEVVAALQQSLSGERPFAPESKLGLPCVVLPYESVERVLGVLGIEDATDRVDVNDPVARVMG